jgi:hypothetical protein
MGYWEVSIQKGPEKAMRLEGNIGENEEGA